MASTKRCDIHQLANVFCGYYLVSVFISLFIQLPYGGKLCMEVQTLADLAENCSTANF